MSLLCQIADAWRELRREEHLVQQLPPRLVALLERADRETLGQKARCNCLTASSGHDLRCPGRPRP